MHKDIKFFKINKLELVVRQNGVYCIGSANSYTNVNLIDNTFNNVLRSNEGGLEINITFGKSYAKENNSVCGIAYKTNVTFTKLDI